MSLILHFLTDNWIFILTLIIAYSIYFLLFNRTDTSFAKKGKELPKGNSVSDTPKKDVSSGMDESVDVDGVAPATFPEDTPHIPYIFNEITEARKPFKEKFLDK